MARRNWCSTHSSSATPSTGPEPWRSPVDRRGGAGGNDLNFLLHRHLAARDLGSEVAALGAMLPDLWPMASRRVRPRTKDTPPPAGDPLVDALSSGVRHHLAADAWFHSSEVFRQGQAETAASFRLAAPRAGRLMAHIAWELCLDGALVRRLGTAAVVNRLRPAVQRCRGPVLAAAVRAWHPALVDDPGAAADFDRRLDGLLRSLLDGDWIDGYRHGAGLAARISGVRRRVGLPPWTGIDAERLSRALDGLLASADERLDGLLEDAVIVL